MMYLTFLQPQEQRPQTPKINMDPEDLFKTLWDTPTTQHTIMQNLTFCETQTYRDRWTVNVTDDYAHELFKKYFSDKLHTFVQNQIDWPIARFENNECYRTFKIPKKTPGKYRDICEPIPELKYQQKNYQRFLEDQVHVLSHRAATAYVRGRSTRDDRAIHQKNESLWELKLDLKNFFPSCNQDFTFRMLEQVYPFGVLAQHYPEYWAQIMSSLEKCFYHDSLPQGTPISPYLTNIIMVPIDEQIRKTFTNYHGYHLEYTRYADDITLSCKYKFDPASVIKDLQRILKLNNTPFKLNVEKTKFQSTSGRNWSLGIMRNKDNRLTVGHKNNQKLRARIFQFYMANMEECSTSHQEAQKLQGIVSYYKMIDPAYTQYVIDKYSTKFGKPFQELMKEVLNH